MKSYCTRVEANGLELINRFYFLSLKLFYNFLRPGLPNMQPLPPNPPPHWPPMFGPAILRPEMFNRPFNMEMLRYPTAQGTRYNYFKVFINLTFLMFQIVVCTVL